MNEQPKSKIKAEKQEKAAEARKDPSGKEENRLLDDSELEEVAGGGTIFSQQVSAWRRLVTRGEL